MTSQSQISIAASIILHALAFLILAGVKLYRHESVRDDNMPVTFVGEQKTMPLRRSIPIRPMISLDKSPRRRSPEHYTAQPEYRSSIEFYVSAPEKVFSEVKSVGQEVFRDMEIQRPSVQMQGRLSGPMATDLLNEPHLRGIQIQPRISGGHDLLGNIVPAQAEPRMDVIDDVLQRFSAVVRGKIESKKRYPIAAQKTEMEGRTGIRMTILKDGRLEKVEIVESSGYEILDRAALQSVHNAAPFPPIPDAAKMDRIEMSIYLVFKLSS